jgi:hypothetical protein
MSTNIEDRIKLARPGDNLTQSVRVLPQRLLAVQEIDRLLILLECLDGARVEGRLAALGGGDGQLDLSVEDMPWVGKFRLEGKALLA